MVRWPRVPQLAVMWRREKKVKRVRRADGNRAIAMISEGELIQLELGKVGEGGNCWREKFL